MKRALAVLAIVASTSAFAADKPATPWSVGFDFLMPYSLQTGGASFTEAGNTQMGIDGRYWMNEKVNLGLRFAFDLYEDNGFDQQIWLEPGVQWHFTRDEAFDPFLRLDLPVALKSDQDMGISGGIGLAWNFGHAIGVENLSMRYDFDIGYLFGIGEAADLLYLNIFRLGFDYSF